MVDRGRPVAADDAGGDRNDPAGCRICNCHRARAAHADVDRSAVCAARRYRAGAALFDLADPRRYADDAAITRDRRSQRAGAALGVLLGGLVVAMAGIVVLAILNSGWFARNAEEARSSTGRRSIRWRASSSISSPSRRRWPEACWPAFSTSTASSAARALRCRCRDWRGRRRGDVIYLQRQRLLRTVWAAAVAAPALLAIAATPVLPWTGGAEVSTSMPAAAIGNFFDDSFERRTNQRLRAVTGDPQLAGLIAMNSRRPHLLLDADAAADAVAVGRQIQRDRRRGGLARLRYRRHAARRPRATVSGPRARSARGFEWLVNGRQSLLRNRLGDRAAAGAVSSILLGWAKALLRRVHHLTLCAQWWARLRFAHLTKAPAPAPWRSRADPGHDIRL